MRTPASENANQYHQVTPLARVEYEMVDNRKGKYLLVGFTIFYIDPARMRAVLNLLRLVQEFVPWPHVVEQADHVDVTHSNLFSGGVSEG